MFDLGKIQYKSANETTFLPIRLTVIKRLTKCNVRVKIPQAKWEKVFANHISVKGLVFKICKEFLQLNSKKTTQLKMSRGSK